MDYQGQASELNQHAARIEVFFKAHPPQTITEAQAKIHELTSIQRSPTQVKAFLHRPGMSRRNVGFIPGKRDSPDKIAQQETFREAVLEPLLAAAEVGKQAVFLWMLPILFTRLF